jgi:hypothetical protein
MSHFNTQMQEEAEGAWLPAIPLPLFVEGWFTRSVECSACGMGCGSEEKYRYHYRTEQLKEAMTSHARTVEIKDTTLAVLHEALALASEDITRGCQPNVEREPGELKDFYVIQARQMSQQRKLARRMNIDPARVDELAQNLKDR